MNSELSLHNLISVTISNVFWNRLIIINGVTYFPQYFLFKQYQISLVLSTLEFNRSKTAPVLMLSLGTQRKKPPVRRVQTQTFAVRAVTPLPTRSRRARTLSPSRSPQGSRLRTRPPPGPRLCRKPTTAMTTLSWSRAPGIEEAPDTGEGGTCLCLAKCFLLFFLSCFVCLNERSRNSGLISLIKISCSLTAGQELDGWV